MSENVRVGIAVLASGSALRFGENKLLKSFCGKPLVEYALSAIPAEYRPNTLVVTCHEGVKAAAARYALADLPNPLAEEGIAAGIRQATEAFHGCDGILFLVADQPLLRVETVTGMLRAFSESPGSIICAAAGKEPMNPCLFPKRFFAELLCLRGDKGGKRIVRTHPDSVILFPAQPEELEDCDTPDHFAVLEKQLQQNALR